MATSTKTAEQAKPEAKETKKASKPTTPFFRTLGTNERLAEVLAGHSQPVRAGSWSAMVAMLLLAQDEATEESTAKLWAEAVERNGETFPGKGGVYHGKVEDHPRKTVAQSTTFGTRRAIRDLHAKGLISEKNGVIVLRPPLSQFAGKVQLSLKGTSAAPARRRVVKKVAKGRSARQEG